MRRSVALLLAVGLTACGALEVASPAEESHADAGEAALPTSDAFLPPNVAASTSWSPMVSVPSGFDPEESHASIGDLADAFGAALFASFGGGPDRPDLGLDIVDETDEGALVVVSETGVGDDSVAGSQYALVVTNGADGWRIEELWHRAMCWRGVSGDLCV